MALQKRYIIITEFYVYADSSKDALKQAKRITDKQIKRNDDRATVIKITELGFGKLIGKTVYKK